MKQLGRRTLQRQSDDTSQKASGGREERPRPSWSPDQEAGRKMLVLLLRGLRNTPHHPGKAVGLTLPVRGADHSSSLHHHGEEAGGNGGGTRGLKEMI